jgi:RHS repeat-associated protein
VRQVINDGGSVVRNYTYGPFGQLLESSTAPGAPSNAFMFTGQWFDDEIRQYYLRARIYDPALMRFTSRDPVRRKFKNPLTLYVYLYCLSDPINRTDLGGEFFGSLAGQLVTHAIIGGLMGSVSSIGQ